MSAASDSDPRRDSGERRFIFARLAPLGECPRVKPPSSKPRRSITNLFRGPGARPDVPSVDEVTRAVRHLRNVNALCFFEGLKTNDGFGMNLSFNASAYRADGGRNFIEVAPRAATLQFRPKDPQGWSWSEGLSLLIAENSQDVVVKMGAQQTAASTRAVALRGEGGGEAQLKLPLLGSGKASVKAGAEASRSRTDSGTRSAELTRTRKERWVEMMRPDPKVFELRLDSPPEDDLVRLNPELNRLSVLFAPEPSAVEVEDVKVSMAAHIKVQGDEVTHALRIRDAGGAWARLLESRNKQVIAELLISKFLRPLHQPKAVWPPKGPSGG